MATRVPLVAETSPQSPGISRVSVARNSNMCDFLETCSVSSRSRRRLRDVRVQAILWSPESPLLDQSRQSRRRLLGESASQFFWFPSHPLPQLISRGSRGDVHQLDSSPLRVITYRSSTHALICSVTQKRVHCGHTHFRVKRYPEFDQLSAELTYNWVRPHISM